MTRVSLKITGAQGQGVNSVGELCAKGLKRAGYCVFGYREYMSLIKGGHSSYQLDISDTEIRSTETNVDILVCFNHHGLKKNLREVKQGGIILHQTSNVQLEGEDQQFIEDRKITILELPTEKILKELKAPPILGNTLLTSVVWSLLGQERASLEELIRERFGRKGERVLQMNLSCIEQGLVFLEEQKKRTHVVLSEPKEEWKNHMLLTGSQAMGLGTIHAGCRVFAGYPMTPSSPLLTFIADIQNRTGMVVKQAEDEITAVQMTLGAMHMGTRAMTTTSGGGYDLMTETVSLAGISETPLVIALAQRPGPGTGLPTWTAQGDLLLAVNSSHGELPRLVLSVSDAADSFSLMPEAFNYAEEYQMPVIILTEKQIAEALYTQSSFDQKSTELRRGKLLTDAQNVKGQDRYDPSVEDGISQRWLPGTEAETYCGQSYEHSPDGSFDETSQNAKDQAEKRMRKMDTLKQKLPEPELFGAADPEVLFVGWGSTKGAVLDAIEIGKGEKVGYLHYTYLWPLKTDKFVALSKQAKKVVLIEGNQQGQLGMLLKQECGIDIPDKILKYDGRPFFIDEIISALEDHV